jgi:hypothetical protein
MTPVEPNEMNFDIFIKGNALNFSYTRPFFDPNIDGGNIMTDSKRVIETRWYVEQIADYLGMATLPDGTFKNFPQPVAIDDKKDIPDGWGFYSARDKGVGIYQKRSRSLTINNFGKPEFKPAGYVKCHTLLQRLEAMQDDNTRMIGGDEASGFLIPTADGRFIPYESLFQAIADMSYNQSWMTRSLNEIKINCMQLVHMGRDTLKGLGIPLRIKRLEILLGDEIRYAAVPTLGGKTVSISSQLGLILMNLGLVVGGNMKVTKVDTDGLSDPPPKK